MFREPVRRLRPRTTAPRPTTFCLSSSPDRAHNVELGAEDRPTTTDASAETFDSDVQAWSASLRSWGGCGDDRGDAGTPPRPTLSSTSKAPSSGVELASTRRRPRIPGPTSFPRAERLYVADEPRLREESYGNRVVRLLTAGGDVVATVNRRRAGLHNERRPNPPKVWEQGRRNGTAEASEPGGVSRLKGRGSSDAWGQAGAKVEETKAAALIPDPMTQTLPWYREPGQAELPALLCGTTATLTTSTPRRS